MINEKKEICANCAKAGSNDCPWTDMVPELSCHSFVLLTDEERTNRLERLQHHTSTIERVFQDYFKTLLSPKHPRFEHHQIRTTLP